MPFTTISFVAFFAIVFFAYYSLPRKFQWHLLLIASLVFYGWFSAYYLIFLFITILLTYAGACLIDSNLAIQKDYLKTDGKTLDREAKKRYKATMEKKRNRILLCVILGLLAMLGTFKYGQFAVDNMLAALGCIGLVHVSSISLDLILPIGLSFYVFQSLGYCIDVSREEVAAERNFLKHALYVSFFPQVMQGPIGNYATLKPQLFAEHSFEYSQSVFGLQRIAWGFFKKFMIANTIANRLDPAWANPNDYPGLFCWAIFLSLYSIQLYADFSGYMDIACGCSQMLGVKIDENFETPYFSKSIAEFWRNWHISLGTWFKNYVFYPILRADWNNNLRKSLKRNSYLASTLPTVVGLLIVWLLIGLWHGADWSYVVYGLFHGSFIIVAVILAPLFDKVHSAFPCLANSRLYGLWQVCRTFAIVTIGYVIFKPACLSKTGAILQQAFQWRIKESVYQVQYALHHSFIWVIIWIAMLIFVDIWHYKHEKETLRKKIRSWPVVIRWILYLLGVLVVIFFGLYGEGFDQFEYFKF